MVNPPPPPLQVFILGAVELNTELRTLSEGKTLNGETLEVPLFTFQEN
jgi:hypothetical protein